MTSEERYENSEELLIEGTLLRKCLVSAGAVSIPEGVTEIGESAFFAHKNITRVTLPRTLTHIGARAFSYCHSLEEICIPDSVTEIGEHAFSACLCLRRVTFPTGLTHLADGVLENCRALESLCLPDSLTEIGAYALFGCRALASIAIPAGVRQIGEAAFGDCMALSKAVIPEGIERLSEHLLAGCRALTSVTLPASLREIGASAFSGCELLETMDIPNGVISVGENALAYCVGLTRVTFPRSVRLIGADCLVGLEPPVAIRMEEPRLFRMLTMNAKLLAVESFLSRYDEGVTTKEECEIYGEFIKKQRKSLARMLGESVAFYRFLTDRRLIKLSEADALLNTAVSIEIKTLLLEYKERELTPEVLLRMEQEEARRIERMLLGEPRTVEDWKREYKFRKAEDGSVSIKKYVGADSVAEVPARIGRSWVRTVGEGAFSECAHVTSVIVEEGVQSIRERAFTGCTSLERIVLPESVCDIAAGAFDGCEGLTVLVPTGSYAARRLRENGFSVEIREE